MPDKKVNALSQFLYVLKSKKNSCDDIVTMADRVVEEYIISKNKLIHRRYKRKNRIFPLFFMIFALPMGVAFVVANLL